MEPLPPYVALTLLAAFLFAVGNSLQKHGVSDRLSAGAPVAGLLAHLPRLFSALLRSRLWLLGLLVTVVAVSVEIQAMAQGDVSVVKPLSRVQTLFVLAIGVGVLRERLSRAELLGIGAMLCSALVLARQPVAGARIVPGTAANAALAFGVASAVGLGVVLADRLAGPRGREHLPAFAAGALFGLGDVLMKAATGAVRTETGGFDLAGGPTIVALLGTAEFSLSIGATLLAFALQQIAFSRGRVSLVVPLIGVGATALVVLLGVVYLGEPLGPARLAGVLAMIAATVLIARPASPRPAWAAAGPVEP